MQIITTYQLDENSCFTHVNRYTVKPFNAVVVSNEDILKEPHNELDVLKWESDIDVNEINFGEVNTGKWIWAKDYRGITLYDTYDGSIFTPTKPIIGTLPEGVTDIARPDESYSWVKNTWVQNKAKALILYRQNKLNEINNNAQVFINELTKDTPEYEKSTWTIQALEAKSYINSNKVMPTPLLDRIALSRGMDRETLINKAYQKAITYETIVSHITGLRQRYEDQLKVASTLEDISKINTEYALPKEVQ